MSTASLISHPGLMSLPAPIRFKLGDMHKRWKYMLGDQYSEFRTRANTAGTPVFQIVDNMQHLSKVVKLIEHSGATAVTQYIFQCRFEASGGMIYVEKPSEPRGQGPYHWNGHTPGQALYLDLSECPSDQLSIDDPAGNRRNVQGCYLMSSQVTPEPGNNVPRNIPPWVSVDATTKCDAEFPTRVIDVLLAGSPEGKKHVFDDYYLCFSLYANNKDIIDLEFSEKSARWIDNNQLGLSGHYDVIRRAIDAIGHLMSGIQNASEPVNVIRGHDHLMGKLKGVGFSQTRKVRKVLKSTAKRYVIPGKPNTIADNPIA